MTYKQQTVFQQTIAQSISFAGIGVHTGLSATVTLLPSKPGTGIVFKRTDVVHENPFVLAHWTQVSDTPFCTKLSNQDGVSVSTVEHLMAALAALEIDNVLVEITGPEVPIMDGSAASFVFFLESAGTVQQNVPRSYVRVLKPVEFQGTNGAWVRLTPSETLSIEVEVNFKGRDGLSNQTYVGTDFRETFRSEVAASRTFGFFEDAQKMWQAGLSKGASLENTLVFQEGLPMNPEGLRYEDECARHKVLDALGDLYLSGAPIRAHYEGCNTGHFLNYKILETLFSDPEAYEIVTPRTAAAPVFMTRSQSQEGYLPEGLGVAACA